MATVPPPKIIRLLTELADPKNSSMLLRFYKDPASVMNEYELTEGEQAIVLSGDLEAIQGALDSASIAAGFELSSSLGIVASYTPPPRPSKQNFVGTF
jgi:hypothetical protein